MPQLVRLTDRRNPQTFSIHAIHHFTKLDLGNHRIPDTFVHPVIHGHDFMPRPLILGPWAKQRALLLETGQVHPSTSPDQGLIRSAIRFPPSGERLSVVGGGEQGEGLDPSLIEPPTNWRGLILCSSFSIPCFYRMQTVTSSVAANPGCLSETRERVETRMRNGKDSESNPSRKNATTPAPAPV